MIEANVSQPAAMSPPPRHGHRCPVQPRIEDADKKGKRQGEQQAGSQPAHGNLTQRQQADRKQQERQQGTDGMRWMRSRTNQDCKYRDHFGAWVNPGCSRVLPGKMVHAPDRPQRRINPVHAKQPLS
ncbi:hypothetical protein [Laribacter hongkongensis]|uniref:hypothetical protein n=1 Tax=Laribacter hongkongensis TaxID=168471 RepID=UPI00167F9E4C|nr:hypothetical protein [Laribacter hongkongensis]